MIAAPAICRGIQNAILDEEKDKNQSVDPNHFLCMLCDTRRGGGRAEIERERVFKFCEG
jgi:hypothetical protein